MANMEVAKSPSVIKIEPAGKMTGDDLCASAVSCPSSRVSAKRGIPARTRLASTVSIVSAAPRCPGPSFGPAHGVSQQVNARVAYSIGRHAVGMVRRQHHRELCRNPRAGHCRDIEEHSSLEESRAE